MPFREVATAYQNSALFVDGAVSHVTATTGPLYYEETPGSGNYNLPLDLSLEARAGKRESKAGPYGFSVDPATGLISIRLKNQPLNFELRDFGYISPLNEWVSANGSPNWDSQKTDYRDGKILLGPNGGIAEICVETTTRWFDVWSGMHASNRSNSKESKTELFMSKAARGKITDNIPALWDENQSDVSTLFYMGRSVPRFFMDGINRNPDLGLMFGKGSKELELRAANGETLGYLPIDVAYAGVREENGQQARRKHGDEPEEIVLRKRLFKREDGYYLAIGMSFAQFRKARAGAIVYDPTYQVGTGNDDGDMQLIANNSGANPTTGSTMTLTASLLRAGWHADNNEWTSGMRFLNIAIAQGATLTLAQLSIAGSDNFTSPNTVKYHASAQNADNAGALSTSSGDFNSGTRARTTEASTWDVKSQTLDTYSTFTVTTTCQAIISRTGWVSGNAMVYLLDTEATSDDYQEWRSYNGSSSLAPKLDITVAATGSFPPIRRLRSFSGLIVR